MSKHLHVALSVIPTMWLFKQKQKHVVSLHHSIHHILNHHVFIQTWNCYGQPSGSPSTCFGQHYWATQHCPNDVRVCEDGSSTRAVSITVSIANIFINTRSKKLTLFTEGMAYCHTEGDEHFKFKGEHVHSSPTHLALCQLDHERSNQQCSCRCDVKCRTFQQCRLRNHQRRKSSGKTHISL